MKKYFSYIFLNVILFNLNVLFCYYFKLSDYLYFFNKNIFLNIVYSNLIIILLNIIYMILYKMFNAFKCNYLLINVINLFIGMMFGFIVLGKDKVFNDYLALISYFQIAFLVISSSMNFESVAQKVFE